MLDTIPILNLLGAENLTTAQAETILTSAIYTKAEAAAASAREMANQIAQEQAMATAAKDNYENLMHSLQQTYENKGAMGFLSEWAELGDSAQKAILELHPEMAELSSSTANAANYMELFASAIERAANVNLDNFKTAFVEDAIQYDRQSEADAAKGNRYAQQLNLLKDALLLGDAESMRVALFGLYEANELLYSGLMETYPMLYKLADGELTVADAARMMIDAYSAQADASAEATRAMREQMDAEKALEDVAKRYHKDTLENLQDAYLTNGRRGFHELWEPLPDTAKQYIMETYAAVGALAEDQISKSLAVVEAIFADALEMADNMARTELTEKLTKGAEGYGEKKRIATSGESGFQTQLKELKSALEDGSFMDTLAGFGEEMSNALLKEHDW